MSLLSLSCSLDWYAVHVDDESLPVGTKRGLLGNCDAPRVEEVGPQLLVFSPNTGTHANICLAELVQWSLYMCVHALHPRLDRWTDIDTYSLHSHLAMINSNSGHSKSPYCLHFLMSSDPASLGTHTVLYEKVTLSQIETHTR